jgi:hypothetical protein
MLVYLYLEALIADEKAADAIWDICDSGAISDDLAALAWSLIATAPVTLAATRSCVLRGRCTRWRH